MKYAEINKEFTNKVNEYLDKGYIINSSTMSGSQGEVTKVDLTNGKEIIRILINRCWYNHHEYDGYEIFVGKANKAEHLINSYGSFNTIWNNELIEISSDKFYHADYYKQKDWFVTEKDIKEISKIMKERYKNSFIYPKSLPDRAKDIALKYVRKQPKCSRARKESVQIIKNTDGYFISYRNHYWKLK